MNDQKNNNDSQIDQLMREDEIGWSKAFFRKNCSLFAFPVNGGLDGYYVIRYRYSDEMIIGAKYCPTMPTVEQYVENFEPYDD